MNKILKWQDKEIRHLLPHHRFYGSEDGQIYYVDINVVPLNRELINGVYYVSTKDTAWDETYEHFHPFSIPQMIAKQFVPNPHNYRDIRHKDGDVSNNAAVNLEWYDKSAT